MSSLTLLSMLLFIHIKVKFLKRVPGNIEYLFFMFWADDITGYMSKFVGMALKFAALTQLRHGFVPA